MRLAAAESLGRELRDQPLLRIENLVASSIIMAMLRLLRSSTNREITGKSLRVLCLVDPDPILHSIRGFQENVLSHLAQLVNVRIIDIMSATTEDFLKLLPECDVVLAFNHRLESFFSARDALSLKIPVLFYSYGLCSRGFTFLWRFRKFIQSGDIALFPSRSDYNAFYCHIQTDTLTTALVPYPVDPLFFRQSPSGTLDNGHCFTGPYRILYAGRQNLQKKMDIVINITAELIRRGHDVALTVAGHDDKAPFSEIGMRDCRGGSALLERARHVLGSRLQVVGQVPRSRLAALYDASCLNIAPSTFQSEDFGFSAAEAMARGCPTLSSAWGGFFDTVVPRRTGYRMAVHLSETDCTCNVDVQSGLQWADNFLRDKQRIIKYRKHAQRLATLRYDSGVYAETLQSILTTAKLRACMQNQRRFGFSLSADVQYYFAKLDERSKQGTYRHIDDIRCGLFSAENGRLFRAFLSPYAIVPARKKNECRDNSFANICPISLID